MHAKFEDFHNNLYMISPIPVSDFINTGILFRQYTGIRFRKYQYISSTPAKAHFQRFEDFKNIGGLINMPRYRIKNKKEVQNFYTSVPLKRPLASGNWQILWDILVTCAFFKVNMTGYQCVRSYVYLIYNWLRIPSFIQIIGF